MMMSSQTMGRRVHQERQIEHMMDHLSANHVPS